ncbi:AAA family ATPase [Deinococcus ruber]|uniref:ATPase n=1 Tax=Deinococcus ruber TaxID=1848197 RepID=A0A918FC89_9DEIO|nr:MoxR family ATPase [Deinococcus ruber]GGR26416.1 ATPase [Deinococcus ruber]
MTDVSVLRAAFQERGYVTSDEFATALELMLALEKPLLIEGPAGVGKTESAKVLAGALGTRLIRLQCYEGLDASSALYEWNYPRQMLRIRLTEGSREGSVAEREAQIFSEDFLLKRPLLEAITQDASPVLLIDEIDRADEAFEAFLLELLSDFQISIPELGTVRATHRPRVILTSNRSRELSDALRRRCLYLWQGYPSPEQELLILHARLPGISARLSEQIVAVMATLRALPFHKVPGVAEALDWGLALMSLHAGHLDARTVQLTRGCIFKAREDWTLLEGRMALLEPIWNEAIGKRPALPESDFGYGNVSVRR